MDFNEYQKQALTTALPTALNLDYLLPGLIAEIGEVFGKEAKAVRDGWDKDRLDREVCSELGDVLWFIAVIAHAKNVQYIDVAGKLRMLYYQGDLDFDPMLDAVDAAAHLAITERENQATEMLGVALGAVYASIECHGSTWETVTQANLDKLADRQARNVIAGSGDTR